MKNRLIIALSLMVIAVITISLLAASENKLPSPSLVGAKKPFYLGVTYCGSSVAGADQLIDSIKNCTNLFVVQSGPLMDNLTDLNQVCSYAVQAGLKIIAYFTNTSPTVNVPSFISHAQATWGSNFLGVYYCDEPGGKMLDTGIAVTSDDLIISGAYGEVDEIPQNQTQPQLSYSTSGIVSIVRFTNQSTVSPFLTPVITTYYPNGTITYTAFPTLIY